MYIFLITRDLVLNDAKYDIRIVLKSENETHFNCGIPRQDKQLKQIRFYRFKERKTFTFNNFTYFFTKIWEGKSLQEVSKKKTKYEIEIEFTDYLTCNSDQLAKSMILKW